MRPIDFFDLGADASPDAACFVVGDVRFTYAEVARLTRRIANRLRANGFEPGAHGAVLSVNDPVAFACTLGLLRTGMVWLPMNPRNTVAENALLLDELDCAVLFVHSAFAPAIGEIRAAAPGIREVVTLDTALEEWLGDATDDPVDVPGNPDALAAISGTSGTTGKPKGVMLSNRNFETFIRAYGQLLPHDATRVYLAAAPMTHVTGRICFPIMAAGGTTVVLPVPDPQAILDAIPKHRVTELFLPPTAIYTLLDQPNIADVDTSSLRYLLYGAAPMRVDMLKHALQTFGPVLCQGFGQTEAPMLISMLHPEDHFEGDQVASDERLRSCGRPTPFVRVAILDDGGGQLPAGEVGEVCVRGDIVMTGYYQNPEATAEVSAHGWHHTGDLGYLDADRFLHLVDRKKDMIVTGGFNVYSAEVEQALAQHPAVAEAVVVGVPDQKWGEAVKAVVQAVPGADVDEAQLIAFCKQRVGGVKAPKSVEMWDELPRNPTGKVLKKQIRERYWSGLERRV